MTDEQVFATLRRALEERAEPDAAFADGLYETLAMDLGFRGARAVAPRGAGAWLRRALGLDVTLDGASSRPGLVLVAIAALLLAFGVGLVILAGQLIRERAPLLTGDEIVSQSQARYPDPPAFDMTVRYSGGGGASTSSPGGPDVIRYRYDGGQQLRTDVVAGSMFYSAEPPGSYRIETATQTATYDAGQKSWYLGDLPAPRPPLFSMFPLNWIAQKPFKPPEPPPGYECPTGWQRQADGVVAERVAYHVTCGAEADFWIDQASFLLVGSGSAFSGTPEGTFPSSPAVEATSLVVNAETDPTLFGLAMPAGAYDANNPPPSTVLAVGQPAPDWTGTLDGGGAFDSRSLLGTSAAVLFWAEWCDPCLTALNDFAVIARASAPRTVQFVTVAWAPQTDAALRAAVTASGGGYPVVRDDDQSISNGWGVTAVPLLVLVRPDGTIASLTTGPVGAVDLEKMVAALTTGGAIPSPPPTPIPSGCGCPAASETPGS